jgi:uncharacterized protein (TIGR02453 family)
MASQAYFDRELFKFLSELAENNDRAWFQDNKERYRRAVQEPMLGFISAIASPLRSISPHFIADPKPTGGSLFRIYRDVRFSRDKRPYKTHAGAQFRHSRGRDVHAPGFYLHLEPGNVFVGAGIWHPAGPTLAAVRDAIVEDEDGWQAALSDAKFTAKHTLGGDSLKRAPRGYDPDHPQVQHLKRKDFVSYAQLSERDACSRRFLDTVVETFRSATPFMRFLTEAVGLEFD